MEGHFPAGKREEYTLHRSVVHHRAHMIHSHSYPGAIESFHCHVFGLWEENGVASRKATQMV